MRRQFGLLIQNNFNLENSLLGFSLFFIINIMHAHFTFRPFLILINIRRSSLSQYQHNNCFRQELPMDTKTTVESLMRKVYLCNA